MNYKHNYDPYKITGMRVSYGNRKRQIQIQELLNELHDTQMDMIDQAVEHSDLTQAKEIIDYIRRK